MCYYNGQKVTRAEYIQLLQIEKAVKDYEFLNQSVTLAFDYGKIAVLKPRYTRDNFDIVQMEWSLLPGYVKNRDQVQKFRKGYKKKDGSWQNGYDTQNAKGEELLFAGKMYREAAIERRCLILSSGFYEWRHVFHLNKRTGEPKKTPEKYPHYIGVKEHSYFYLAGIWQVWTDQDTGETVDTVSLVTTRANELMAKIHNSKERMPTILPDALAWEWIMDDLDEERITQLATYQFPAEQMEACTVQKDFLKNEDPTVPFIYEDLAALHKPTPPAQTSLF
ncbi:SOS response-associated peptidase [Dyadobacter subterraneus]|uniref:Abasic site processing protein n=1 Tax=Dyadobacter subterraneus TaxID=2773304 RepID=A0ABR9WCL7_9BACT|nr:SOS response-associated peptidase family protein [Dyadobacter subterraneus]MBE9462111.1 SOS response-associated peptidase family protein [Dyadobacter subterraneus]